MKKKFLLGISLLAIAGTMVAALASNAVRPLANAEEQTYSIVLDNAFAKTVPVDANDQFIDGFTYTTTNGNNIKFDSSLMFLPNDGWGGFTANCWTHADAEFHNATPITGIKSINLHGWFIGEDTKHIRVITAANANFTEEVTTYYLNKGTGTPATLGEVFSLEFPDSPSFIKFMPTEGVNQVIDFYRVTINYSCTPIVKDNIYLTAPWWESRPGYVKPGPSGTFDAPTANGSNVTIVCNQWVEYPNSWGCIFTNGQHWDAEFHNSTSFGKILRIEFGMWWDVNNASTNTGEKIVNITTASDAAFTENVKKTQFKKTGEVTAAQTRDSYTLISDGTASYFKFDFGDSAANAHFSGVTTFKVIFTA